jgi:hypothetical protein
MEFILAESLENKSLIPTRKFFRLTCYFFFLGLSLILGSISLDSDSMIIFVRDLHFKQNLQSWQLSNLLRMIAFFRDAMWFCGIMILVLAGMVLYGKPVQLRKFVENADTHPARSFLYISIFLHITVSLMFIITEFRMKYNNMYHYGPAGQKEQRAFICGDDYINASKISEELSPDDRVLLAGKMADPFFLNYYLYPVRLFHYDSRYIEPKELNKPYIKKWMNKKGVHFALIYRPGFRPPWKVLQLKKNRKTAPP